MFGIRSIEGSVSDNHYAVSTDGSFRVRAAGAGEWNSAEPIDLHAGEPAPDGRWQGKVYQQTGSSLQRAMLSPDKTVMALLSITETERPEGLSPMILPRSGTYRGTTYLDLFDTSSGERVAAGQAPYAGPNGSITFERATWAADRAFVLPLDLLEQTCFVAIRPAR